MVGRYESSELKKEALAHEDLWVRPDLLSRSCCLFGALVAVLGVLAPALGLGRPFRAQSMAPSAPEARLTSTMLVDPSVFWESPYLDVAASGEHVIDPGWPPRPIKEPPGLGLDLSLVALTAAVLVLCVGPPALRMVSGPWAAAPPLWGGGERRPDSLLVPTAGGVAGRGFDSSVVAGAARGRVVDVKPGELAGHHGWASGARYGPVDWAGSGVGASPWSAGGPLPGAGAAVGRADGSWLGFGPSAYRAHAPGYTGALGAAAARLGFGTGMGGGYGSPATGLPTETELTETYVTFGVELQRWAPAFASLVDRDIIEPLIRQIDESDQLWHQVLTPLGWRLTPEAPRLAYPPGVGPSAQELSVFDRHLPKPLSDDPRAAELWSKRQQIELFLVHPSFEPAQRQYVLDRLREWRQRGVMAAMRHELRPSDMMPTDAHILENLMIKMLNFHLDFANCFMSTGHAPPLAKHLGQSPTAYLMQVTDQSISPRPAPHYEVVTLQKTWKIRPGNTNLLEALPLLLDALRRQSKSYQSFPQVLRQTLEVSGSWNAAPRAASKF